MAYRKDYEELAAITRIYDLILWSCNHTGKFPAITVSCWANASNAIFTIFWRR